MKTVVVMLTDAAGRALEEKAQALNMTAAELASRMLVRECVVFDDQPEQERQCAEMNR